MYQILRLHWDVVLSRSFVLRYVPGKVEGKLNVGFGGLLYRHRIYRPSLDNLLFESNINTISSDIVPCRLVRNRRRRNGDPARGRIDFLDEGQRLDYHFGI